MIAPPNFDTRSIFSYPPPTYPTSAKVFAASKKTTTKDDLHTEDIKAKYPDITDCPSEVHCELPDGVKVENHPLTDGQSNWGLYASRVFPKGTVIFIPEPDRYIYDKDTDFKLVIDPDGPTITLNTKRHLSPCEKGVRAVITYGSLINHSCDPNSYLDYTYSGLKSGERLACIALRDIQPNDEITVDYNFFAYSMIGILYPSSRFIDRCLCRTPTCRGFCHGFKYINEVEQEKLLPYICFDVQVAYWEDKLGQ